MKQPLISTFILLFLLVFSSEAQKKKQFSIAFYNCENLFDTKDDPAINDEEFLPEGKNQWTEERYRLKLKNLAKVIDSLGDGPAVLGVCEVENRQVLEDLVRTEPIAKKKYGIVHENSPDQRGIDVAMIYQENLFTPIFHQMIRVSLEEDPQFITRDIMLVKGLLNKTPIYFFINHWPSRRGGEEKSILKRVAAAKAARTTIDTILAANPKANIMLMGDFNDEPTDSSMKEVLKASLSQDQVNHQLFNTMGPLKMAGEGSHHFNNGRHMLDQIVISQALIDPKSKLHWKSNSSTIYKPVWMQDQNPKYKGSPYRTYAGAKFLGGFSDHFPVFTVLEY